MEIQGKMTRRSFIAGSAVAAAAAGLTLTGCGKKEGAASGSAAGASGSAAKKGGVITAANAYKSTACNPIGNSSALMLAATWHVFEGLYDMDLHTYKTYKALAGADPVKVSGTEYEVALRDSAKFSDGSDVKADDVVNAFQKNMANSTYGAFLSFIDTVEKKDDTTVTFKLKYAFDESLIPARLSVVKIFPKSQTEEDLKSKPIGSGPWAYGEINGEDGGKITFTPNEYYTGSFPATAEAMEWSPLLDETARTTALQEGTVMVMENVPDANADQLTGAGASVDYVQGFNQAFLMFNTLKAPFNDKRVRQAFFYAIDVDKLIANQLAGHATPVTSYLTEDHKNYHKASNVYTYDPEKAKSLLAEAGASDLAFTLQVNNNWVKSLAPQIKNDLEAIGVSCTIDEKSIVWSELAESDSVLPYEVMLTPGDPTCFGNDPDLLLSWWYGDNDWTRGRSCWKKAGDGKFDELQALMQTARESSGSEQQEAWNKCFDLLSEEVPLYALFHRELATGYQADAITGFEPIATTGLVFLGASVKA